MSYLVEYEPDALADLERLPQVLRGRVLNKINWLAENFDALSHCDRPFPTSGSSLVFTTRSPISASLRLCGGVLLPILFVMVFFVPFG